MAPRRPSNVNPRLHAAKQCAGYQRGVVIGDGGHRYTSQRWTPRAVDPEHEVCARCQDEAEIADLLRLKQVMHEEIVGLQAKLAEAEQEAARWRHGGRKP